MATIVTKNSSTASAVPTTSDLVQGELAVNVTDKRIFTENASTQIVELGTNPSSITTATATVTGTLTANGTFASSNAVITGGSINSTPIGATTPSTVRGSTVTATTGFVGGLTGNVTGNLTGNVTGNVTGNLTGNVTGNVTASSGTTTLNDLVVNGTADFTNTKLTNITTPTVGTDAANKSYVDDTVAAVIDSAPAALDTLNELAAALGDDANFAGTVTTALATKLPLAGGTMTGAIAMGTSKITGLGNPTSAQDAATKTYVDTADALKLNLTGGTMSGAIAMGTNKITGVGNPTLAQDAATKDYVDDILGSATSAATSAAAASTSASNAATSASNAASSATASANSASAAAASYDAFDDRYLGDKASDPTLDNDGNALLTGALYFNTTSDVMKVYDGSAWNIAAISSASPTFTGTVTADGLSLGDNDKATFGAGNDLEIYYDGSNSYILNTAPYMLIESGTIVLRNTAGTEDYAKFNENSDVTLYFNNNLKFATTNTGIDVTGTATMDGLTVEGSSAVLASFARDGSDGDAVQIFNGTVGSTRVLGLGGTGTDGTINSQYGGIKIQPTGTTSAFFASGGDISFYEDTGTTPKFFWDASAEALGIGTSTVLTNAKLDVRDINRTGNSANQVILTTTAQATGVGGTLGLGGLYDGSNSTMFGVIRGGKENSTSSNYAGYLSFDTVANGNSITERMRIDSSGNVGIGTSSPSSYNAVADNLVIGTTSGSNGLTIVAGTGNDGSIHFADGTSGADAYRGQIYYSHAGNYMVFSTNAAERMRIDSSGELTTTNGKVNLITVGRGAGAVATNTAVGASALAANTSGAYNTAIGAIALATNTSSGLNTAVGYNAMNSNNGGSENSAFGVSALASNTTGNYNIAIGRATMANNTTGSNNTATGKDALASNTTASNNTANGFQALLSNTTASNNTAVGYQAGYSNTTGTPITAFGYQAAYTNSTADWITAFGYQALYSTTAGPNTAFGRALVTNTTGTENTAMGMNANYYNTTGSNNVALGSSALFSNTTGGNNTATGYQALYSNTEGAANTANGLQALYSNTTANNNAAYGYASLYSNTTGNQNTASGNYSLYTNSTGIYNTAYGYAAMYSNTEGGSNVAVGMSALNSNTTGNYNTASGYAALSSNTTASNNTATGYLSLYSNTTGDNNTATGWKSLYSNTTGLANTAVGLNALLANTTGISNTAVGQQALSTNTTGGNNTAFGLQSLFSNTEGGNNTATGYQALFSNTTANNNTAVGYQALYSNTTATGNTANGFKALLSNTTGGNNTATGYEALFSNTEGYNNAAHGLQTLRANTTGHTNAASGMTALYSNTTGIGNTALGNAALYNNTTGSGNIGIGFANSAGTYAPVFDPYTENNRVVMGHTSVTNAYVQVAWTVVSDARDKMNFAPVPHGLDFVKQLNPVAYQFKIDRDTETPNGNVRYGFKAQDILALEGDNPVIIDNEDENKLKYNGESLVPVLVKAMQEQQAIIESLTNRIAALEGN